MTTIPTSQVSNSNLLHRQSANIVKPEQVFTGDTRVTAIKHLTAAIVDRRQLVVMQLINKDPSLVFEMIQLPVRPNSHALCPVTAPYVFPLACLKTGLAAGYVAAIGYGFAVDTPLQNGATNLLHAALTAPGTSESHEANVSLLLGMGANPALMPSSDAIYAAVASSFPLNGAPVSLGVLSMLIEVKADFSYQKSFICPFSAMVNLPSSTWGFTESAGVLAKMMARLLDAGADINRATGTPTQTPIARAVGQRNGEALKTLLRLGASSDATSMNGRDIFEVMTKNGMSETIPAVQAIMMERAINHKTASVAASAPAPVSARRRVGGF